MAERRGYILRSWSLFVCLLLLSFFTVSLCLCPCSVLLLFYAIIWYSHYAYCCRYYRYYGVYCKLFLIITITTTIIINIILHRYPYHQFFLSRDMNTITFIIITITHVSFSSPLPLFIPIIITPIFFQTEKAKVKVQGSTTDCWPVLFLEKKIK